MAVPMPRVEGVEHRTLRVAGLRVHVAEAGAGEPVVMLHGWPQHWYMWRGVIPPLAERYRVICPDLPGFGWSEAPADAARFDPHRLSRDVLALLDVLELDRVRLVGHDWGGLIGFMLSLDVPERIERYLALNITHPWTPRGAALRESWRFWYMLVNASPLLGERLHRHVPQYVRQALLGGTADKSAWSEEELAAFVDAYREPDGARAGVQIYRQFLISRLPALLRGQYEGRRLTVPTRLVFGAQDPALRPSMLKGFEDHADDMQVELVPDASHFIADEQPDLVADRALSFFSKTREPTAATAG